VRDASANVSDAAERLAAEVQAFFVRLRSDPLDRRMENDPNCRGPERSDSHARGRRAGRAV
jgi:methyl-accepting chemotaxis protein